MPSTSAAAVEPADDAAAAMTLVLRAGPLLCALPLDEIIETMRPLAIEPLAGTPAFVRGISVVRGVPCPVIDLARLLGGHDAPLSRFVAVRTDRGPVAFATGEVLGIRPADTATTPQGAALPAGAATALVAAVRTFERQPLFVLQPMRVAADLIWAAAAAPTGRS